MINRRKKILPLTAELIKALILSKARFVNKNYFVATEVGDFSADVLIVDKKDKLTEIEVKISKSDLVNDFKKFKHKVFNGVSESIFTPHKFYFCVPEFLVAEAITLTENTNYGVMKCRNWYGEMRASSDKIIIVKQAKEIHNKPLSKEVKEAILMRMGSELTNHKLERVLSLKASSS